MPTVIVSLGPESQVVIPGCLSCMCVILVYLLVCCCRTSVGVGLTSMTFQTDLLTALLELGLPAEQSQVVIDIMCSHKCTPMHLSVALNNARRARNTAQLSAKGPTPLTASQKRFRDIPNVCYKLVGAGYKESSQFSASTALSAPALPGQSPSFYVSVVQVLCASECHCKHQV